MKTKLSFPCLLLSAGALVILPVASQEKPIPNLAENRAAFHTAIQNRILNHINPQVLQADRFSRVLRPMPAAFHYAKIVSENADGVIEFQIFHINRMVEKTTEVRVATGSYAGKNGELMLKDDENDKWIPPTEHPLLKRKLST